MASSDAQTTSNYGLAPINGWVQLNPGQSQWYQFHTDLAPTDATDKHILVQLTADPVGSANFAVWSASALSDSKAGDTSATAVGNGTVQTRKDSDGNTVTLYNGDLLWVSQSTAGGDYFIGVQPTTSSPSRYMLKISGPYVSFPGMPVLASAQPGANAQTPPMLLPATGQNAAPSTAGSSANNPLRLDGQTHTLRVGQQQWYAFPHAGPDADGNEQTAQVILHANPQNSARFSVWTADGLRLQAEGDADNGVAVGNGSLHPRPDGDNTVDQFGGNLEWAGQFHQSGTFYVQVIQTGNQPSTYSLEFTQR